MWISYTATGVAPQNICCSNISYKTPEMTAVLQCLYIPFNQTDEMWIYRRLSVLNTAAGTLLTDNTLFRAYVLALLLEYQAHYSRWNFVCLHKVRIGSFIMSQQHWRFKACPLQHWDTDLQKMGKPGLSTEPDRIEWLIKMRLVLQHVLDWLRHGQRNWKLSILSMCLC